ncbi:uncharacterized protein LY89DRAFT_686934 [Mollisia scopiformis]|uniref:DUF7730 domain-containing protein n=1 Tax=Mollisia scopiformis TaxID=149040 RepID=A0A194X3R8_MOLSC|nr:uncharacterized protein LY89DRAFT_686934 [Mollisia scopiformis]KUJ14462.1 hypothetical protein LY89DRAFT_686934 [Mollisia scopiformis]
MRNNAGLLPDLIPCLPNRIISKIPGAVLAVYFIVTLPIYCVAAWFVLTFRSCLEPWMKARACRAEKERQKTETKIAIMSHTPKILGPRRGRALSIGRPETPTKIEVTPEVGAPTNIWKTTVDEQENCRLFKLPFELRRQIFEEVLGGYMIHIFFMENYLPMSHSRCKSEREGKCACQVFGKGQWKAYQPRTRKQKGAVDQWGQCELLALSKTCRRIYSETIEILYGCNTFDFNSIIEVFRFSLTVLPERMQLMKDVRWKYIGIYDGINPRYMSHKRFAYPRIGNGDERICKKMPWLGCRRSDEEDEEEDCSCLTCWTPVETPDVEQQQLVIYNWLMRLAEEREAEKILEESPRSSGTFDD